MSRINYWSSSRFSHWLRSKFGLKNPRALSASEWREWKKDSKTRAPFIHWLTDVALNKIQDFFCWPKDRLWDLRCALNARFFDKYHYMPTRLDPWKYHEVDTRILHGMFETLVDFIEIEKAWMHVIWGQDENRKKFGYSWWEMNGWTNWLFTEKRHPDAGLAYLDWERSLVFDDAWFGNHEPSIQEAKEQGRYGMPTGQAKDAQEQYELYNWWKNIRPNRPDPYDISGYNDYFKRIEEKNGGDILACLDVQSPEDMTESRKCSASCHEIEEAYEKEDEEMLIRLVKIRRSLWT